MGKPGHHVICTTARLRSSQVVAEMVMGSPFLSRLGLPALVSTGIRGNRALTLDAGPDFPAGREDVDVRRQVGDEVVDRHAAPFRARVLQCPRSKRSSLGAHDTRLRHDQVIEIGVGALRGEPNDAAAGAGPAFHAAHRGGLAFAIAVVVDQDDQPLDPGNDGEPAQAAARDRRPSRLQRRRRDRGCGWRPPASSRGPRRRPAATPLGQSLITPMRPRAKRSTLQTRPFCSSRAVRWIPIGLVAFGVAHEREQAGPKLSRSERAAGHGSGGCR